MPASHSTIWWGEIMAITGSLDRKGPKCSIYFEGFGSGYDFIETMGMKLAAGKRFCKGFWKR